MVRFKRAFTIALCSLLLTTTIIPVYATGEVTPPVVDDSSNDSSNEEDIAIVDLDDESSGNTDNEDDSNVDANVDNGDNSSDNENADNENNDANINNGDNTDNGDDSNSDNTDNGDDSDNSNTEDDSNNSDDTDNGDNTNNDDSSNENCDDSSENEEGENNEGNPSIVSDDVDYSEYSSLIPDGCTLDTATGIITLPGELGTISLVDCVKNDDGTVTLKDGSIINADKSIKLSNGVVVNADGTVDESNKVEENTFDGELITVTVSDGDSRELKFPAGSSLVEDSTTKVKLPDDTVLDFEGCSIDTETGNITLADGIILKASGEVLFTNGAIMAIDGTVSGGSTLPFEYKEPEGNLGLFYSYSFKWNDEEQKYELAYADSNNYGLLLHSSTDFKVVLYNSESDLYYSSITKQEDDKNIIALKEATDISTALNDTRILQNQSFFITPKSNDIYILFFNSDATDFSGLVYTIKFSDILNHIYENSQDSSDVDTSSNTISVSVVKKIERNGKVTGAKFKVDYNLVALSNSDKMNALSITDFGNKSLLNSNLGGSTTVTLNNLENKVYKFTVNTQQGSSATFDFNVDFITTDTSSGTDVDITTKPNVTFTGIPDSAEKGTKVTLTMHTDNIESIMRFDGKVLGNKTYGKAFEFNVKSNGTYKYTATTKGGQTVEGELKIEFFKDKAINTVEDPINMALLDDAETGSTLTQTGMNVNIIVVISSLVLVVLGSLILLNKKYKFIGGIHRG